MSDLRERIFSRQHLRRTTVEVFGETIGVRQFTVLESRDFLARLSEAQAAENSNVATLELFVHAATLATCHPDTGDRLFTPEDADWLRGQSAEDVGKIGQAIFRINGLSEQASDESVGNSSETPTSDSGSV